MFVVILVLSLFNFTPKRKCLFLLRSININSNSYNVSRNSPVFNPCLFSHSLSYAKTSNLKHTCCHNSKKKLNFFVIVELISSSSLLSQLLSFSPVVFTASLAWLIERIVQIRRTKIILKFAFSLAFLCRPFNGNEQFNPGIACPLFLRAFFIHNFNRSTMKIWLARQNNQIFHFYLAGIKPIKQTFLCLLYTI